MDETGTARPLARNLKELLHLLVDSLPTSVVAHDGYLAIRRRLSKTPARFTPPSTLGADRRGDWTLHRGDWLARKMACEGVDLVVEGFPGSANSYVSNSLRESLPDDILVVSHFHYTAQLKRALALGIPAVVLVRDPLGAATSFKSKDAQLWDWVILLRWLRYHRYVHDRLDHLDVVLFDDFTRDLGAVAHASEAVADLLGERELEGDPELRRASPQHRAITAADPLSRTLLRRCEELYRRLAPRLRRAAPADNASP